MKHGFRLAVSAPSGKVLETHIYLFKDLTYDILDDVEIDMAGRALDSEYVVSLEHMPDIMHQIEIIRRTIDGEA